jgi:ABC transport system ATP-binding/permease protein
VAVLVDLERVSARTPDRSLFDQLSVTISTGDRIGVVGINGTGKSTLLRLIAGVASPESGEVRRGRGTRVGYLDQEADLPAGQVLAAVGEGWEAEAILERLGMGADASAQISELSGGQAKRVALARVLANPTELLVLDEPTNHLDLTAIAWLERHLANFRGGLVVVSHDRHLLDRVTTRMLELDRGSQFIHDGGYASYLAARAEREERAVSAEAVRRNLARHELAWLRRGAPARTRKPQARIDKALAILNDRPAAAARAGELSLAIGTPRLGDKVIEATGLVYSYDEASPLVLNGVDLDIGPGERLGVVGPNGIGKSTLLDLLAGRRQPNAGSIEVGTTVVVGYYDQLGVELDPTARVQDLVAGPNQPAGSLQDIALMERFWFTGDLPFAPVGTLSGGERRRLQMLLVLAKRPNVLFLDEPTNNLDLDTIRILEEFFEEWTGALVVVSHDRTFLDRTIDRLVGLDSNGTLSPVTGGLAAWIAEAERRSASGRSSAAVTPQSSSGATSIPTGRSATTRGRSASTIHRELRDAEREMTRLGRLRDELTSRLSTTTQHTELAEIGSALATTEAALAATEHRWLELSEESERRA